MAEEKSLLRPFTPELDSKGERVDSLLMTTDERAAKVDTLEVVLFRLEVGDLPDVVTTKLSAYEGQLQGVGGEPT